MGKVNLYEQMLATAAEAGINVIPRERQYELLALVHVYGDEPFVFDEHLHADVIHAAQRNGLKPGEKPNSQVLAKIAGYEAEIKAQTRPTWFDEIESCYGISIPSWNDRWQLRDDWKEHVHGGIRVPPGKHRQAGQ